MTAPRALALSDKQLALLQAASLPVGERDHFLQSVARLSRMACKENPEARLGGFRVGSCRSTQGGKDAV